jgi:multidrug efflux pump subunit AcrB
VQAFVGAAQRLYAPLVAGVLEAPWLVVAGAFALLAGFSALFFQLTGKQEFLPAMDDGRVRVMVFIDPGSALDEMDRVVRLLERLAHQRGGVKGISVTAGGSIFGRTQRERPNRSTLDIQLVPVVERKMSVASGARWRASTMCRWPRAAVRRCNSCPRTASTSSCAT